MAINFFKISSFHWKEIGFPPIDLVLPESFELVGEGVIGVLVV